MILAKTHLKSLSDLTLEQQQDLANVLSVTTIKYDNLFECSFPYSMGIHQAPVNTDNVEHAHFHIHFYPPLLRSATVKKFLSG